MHREVVITRAGLVAGLGVLFAVLAHFGLDVSPHIRELVDTALVIGLPIVLPLATGLWARLRVTPVFDPRDNAGRPLEPARRTIRLRSELRDNASE